MRPPLIRTAISSSMSAPGRTGEAMTRVMRYVFLASVAAGMLPRPSFAQQAAQPAASSGNLEEIVVTARRREEHIQSVPIAITAFSQTTLSENNILSTQDLQFFVPSMTVASP